MIRAFASVVLSLALGLASMGLAYGRTQSGLTTQITICQGEAVAVISLDARGNPVAMVHHCPDCLTGTALGLPGIAVPPRPLESFTRAGWPLMAGAHGGLDRPTPRAQGPPLSV